MENELKAKEVEENIQNERHNGADKRDLDISYASQKVCRAGGKSVQNKRQSDESEIRSARLDTLAAAWYNSPKCGAVCLRVSCVLPQAVGPSTVIRSYFAITPAKI